MDTGNSENVLRPRRGCSVRVRTHRPKKDETRYEERVPYALSKALRLLPKLPLPVRAEQAVARHGVFIKTSVAARHVTHVGWTSQRSRLSM